MAIKTLETQMYDLALNDCSNIEEIKARFPIRVSVNKDKHPYQNFGILLKLLWPKVGIYHYWQ